MRDAAIEKQALRFAQNALPRVERIDDEVRRQRDPVRREHPDMQVVHRTHARNARQITTDSLDRKMRRNTLEQGMDDFAQKPATRKQDERTDQERKNRVDRRPPRPYDDDPRDERRQRPQEIADDVEQRAARVQRLLAVDQQPPDEDVDEHPDQRDDRHGTAVNLLRDEKAPDGRDREEDDDPHHEDDVQQGRERFDAAQAEAVVFGRRTLRNLRGDRRHRERGAVGHHVARVAEERQRTGYQTRKHFDPGKAERHRERPHQTVVACLRRVVVRVRGVRMMVVRGVYGMRVIFRVIFRVTVRVTVRIEMPVHARIIRGINFIARRKRKPPPCGGWIIPLLPKSLFLS